MIKHIEPKDINGIIPLIEEMENEHRFSCVINESTSLFTQENNDMYKLYNDFVSSL